jgi:RimJ/RimL family protein N-acetyltransferase
MVYPIKKIDFVPYSVEFLNLSFEWLTDPLIKRLTDAPDITKETQLNWFNSLSKREDYKLWGVVAYKKNIGVAGLKNITQESAEYFGFIGDKSCWNKGISQYMLRNTCTYAREKGLKELWLKVINENVHAIKAYKNFGFAVYQFDPRLSFMKYIL